MILGTIGGGQGVDERGGGKEPFIERIVDGGDGEHRHAGNKAKQSPHP
jgi:hypothetical protein